MQYGWSLGSGADQVCRSKDPDFYWVTHLNGVSSVAEADDAAHSRQRKVLTRAFAGNSLCQLELLFKGWVDKLSSRLAESRGKPVGMVSFH
jgi:cytochrome P450